MRATLINLERRWVPILAAPKKICVPSTTRNANNGFGWCVGSVGPSTKVNIAIKMRNAPSNTISEMGEPIKNDLNASARAVLRGLGIGTWVDARAFCALLCVLPVGCASVLKNRDV